MDLSIYDIIKDISVTPKSRILFDKMGKITLQVHKDSNKVMIKNAIEKIWDVKVRDIRIINIKGKNKTFGRRPFKDKDRKKAIVTLKEGYKIDLPGQFESMGVPSVAAGKSETVKGK